MANDLVEELDITQFAQAAAARRPVESAPPAIGKAVPAAQRVEPIVVRYLTDAGDLVEETVQSTVPLFAGNVAIARMEAQLCGPGVSFTSMSPERAAWVRDLARAQVQLTKVSPDYLKYLSNNMSALADLMPHLYTHENLFFRSGATPSGATQSVTRLAPSSAMDRWLAPSDASGQG